jgi:hypothetical protein
MPPNAYRASGVNNQERRQHMERDRERYLEQKRCMAPFEVPPLGGLGLRIHAHHNATLVEDTVELNREVSSSALKMCTMQHKQESKPVYQHKQWRRVWLGGHVVVEKVSHQVANMGKCMEHTEDNIVGLKTWHHGVSVRCVRVATLPREAGTGSAQGGNSK